MSQIQEKFKFKNNKYDDPYMYLGASLNKKKIDGRQMWTMSSQEYLSAAIKTIEEQDRSALPSKAFTPLPKNYSPELDSSRELNQEDITYYQELIGILRWAIEIGRVDIHHEVSIMSAYQASPRAGHLKHLLHISVLHV